MKYSLTASFVLLSAVYASKEKTSSQQETKFWPDMSGALIPLPVWPLHLPC